jgi:hypothetical protein
MHIGTKKPVGHVINISAISWRPVLVVEEAGENHRSWASNW